MYIASASTTVKFHEFSSGQIVYHYQPGSKVDGPIRSISWSKDGNWLALVPASGVAEIVSVKEQLKLIHSIQDVEEPSYAVFQNTTKKHIALGTKSGQVLVYDIKARSIKKRFPRTSSMITHVDYSAKDTHIVAGCRNGEVMLYSNITNNLSTTFRVPNSETISALRANPVKRNLIIGGSNEGVVVVWDTNINKAKFSMGSHKAPVTSVAFSPVNSDLVVSTGMDRQFCFYDIEDSKCIASVEVENSLMAVDFSHDGTHFVVASQSGKVYIYDSRRIQQPIYSFDAHQSAIKHLLLQTMQEVSNFSACSIPVDSIKRSEDVNDGGRNSDSFNFFIQEPTPPDYDDGVRTASVLSNEAGDSFMAALGLGDKSNVQGGDSSFGVSTGMKKWLDSKSSVSESPAPTNSTKILHEKLGLSDSKNTQIASTPKYLSQNFAEEMSPIVSSSYQQPSTQGSVTVADIQTAARDVMKEELKSMIDDIKIDMRYQSMSTVSQMRRMCLDLQMAMIKEFIKLENNYNSIKDEMAGDGPTNEQFLLHENAELKKRIAFLEEQIGNLTTQNSSSQNNNS